MEPGIGRSHLWKFGLVAVVAAWVWFAFLSPMFVEEWKPLTAVQIDAKCGWKDRQLQRECRHYYVRQNEAMQKLLSR